MRSFSISIYAIRMKSQDQADQYMLDQLPSGQDFFELLNQFLKNLKLTVATNETNQELLKVSSLKENGRTLSGLIERGEYGIESKLVNIDNQKTSYKRKEEDAELLPYYFLAVVPENKKLGILAIQRSGLSGIKTPFENALEKYLQEKEPNCRLEIERLVPGKVIEQYLERGKISKIRFVKFSIPTDIADFVQDGHNEDAGTVELQITAKKDIKSSLKNSIRRVLNQDQDVKEFFALKNFDYDTVKIEFEIGGKHRTIDLADPESVKADYDVTKNIEIMHGHPTYNSMDEVAREIVRDIVSSMGLEVDDV